MKLIVVYNNIFPLKRFTAMTILPFMFVRKDRAWAFNAIGERHEGTHIRQQLEMLVVGVVIATVLAASGCGWLSLLSLPLFFYWYGIEWLVRLCIYRNMTTAYKNVAFEREAYDNMYNITYLEQRDVFAWIRYIRK